MIVFFSTAVLISSGAIGASETSSRSRAGSDRLYTLLRVELMRNYPGARIEIQGEPKHRQGESVKAPTEAVFLGDNSRGEAILQLRETAELGVQQEEILVAFAA